jgi:aryl-alcohol dehydrogenase-like predicted oxidoreductase
MKLTLGTAQFGLNYGISNVEGQCSATEVRRILELAENEGITLLDTAPNYGSAESVVGDVINNLPSIEVMSKVPALMNARPGEIYSVFDASLTQTCLHLNRKSVDTLLVHKYQDLTGPNGREMMQALIRLKEQGRTRRIGISAYTYAQVSPVLAQYPIDVVQVPLNVLDQRLLKTTAQKDLQKSGIELHVRSIFLQGVLMLSPVELPEFLTPLAPVLQSYQDKLAQTGLSKLTGALAFVCQQPAISRVIVGVTKVEELKELLYAYKQASEVDMDFSAFSVSDDNLISPANWPNAWPPENLVRKK